MLFINSPAFELGKVGSAPYDFDTMSELEKVNLLCGSIYYENLENVKNLLLIDYEWPLNDDEFIDALEHTLYQLEYKAFECNDPDTKTIYMRVYEEILYI